MKKCLILANSFKNESQSLSCQIKDFLNSRQIETTVFSYNGRSVQGTEVDYDFSGYDFVVTLGGDGTVLFACRGCAPLGIPVFAVNLGEFGFLAGVQKENWKVELEQFLSGKGCISSRCLVNAEVIRDGKTVFKHNCMNDVVISSATTSKLINLNVAYDRALLGPFKSTGIIISTATGSTAYSAAAGGPIVEPDLDVMVLTPISSFSLSARPLVFGSSGEIAVTVLPSRVDTCLSIDGQINFNLNEKDVIILSIAKCRAQLAEAAHEKFYSALQSKLNWSGGPRA